MTVACSKSDDASKKHDEKAEAPKAEKAEPEKNEAAPDDEKAKLIARNKELIQKFKDEATEKAKRWTDELKAKAKELADTDFKNVDHALSSVLDNPTRTPGNSDRDAYRHPGKTIKFCGITPESTVIEYGAGGGWYSEILAPMLAKKGKLIVVSADPNGPEDMPGLAYGKRLQFFLEQSPEAYGKVEHSATMADGTLKPELAGKADVVIAFREMHNWYRSEKLDARTKSAFEALKPGGKLCIVQHRANADAKAEDSAKLGYLPEAWLIAEIEKSGFKLEEKSEINANPKDTHDHPEGVWALPPSFALGDKDKDKYQAIGESDRMTLRFTKPK